MERWKLYWGDGSLVTGKGTQDDPYVYPADKILGPPTAGQAPLPAPEPDRDYATAEEEWTVAKQSAWNWLVDRMLGGPLTPEAWLNSWRYPEPPDAPSGRKYELRQSYEAMQTFARVFEFGLGFISPAIVESAFESGVAQRWGSHLLELMKDTRGGMAIGGTLEEARAKELIESILGETATKTMVQDFVMFKKAYQSERKWMELEGVALEGFEAHILQVGSKKFDVNIGMLRGSRREDAKAALKLLGIDKLPDGFVWHHHPDFGRMVAIPKVIHDQSHWGGVAIFKSIFGVPYK
ncbi:HNH endonuclease [Streptomyces sp. NPDC006476]|uniref:HNH endonuclease n=1 Tax=Streptomyces sp. NPDC006476 TaxID=3157175 RepID=UPI0033B1850A